MFIRFIIIGLLFNSLNDRGSHQCNRVRFKANRHAKGSFPEYLELQGGYRLELIQN